MSGRREFDREGRAPAALSYPSSERALWAERVEAYRQLLDGWEAQPESLSELTTRKAALLRVRCSADGKLAGAVWSTTPGLLLLTDHDDDRQGRPLGHWWYPRVAMIHEPEQVRDALPLICSKCRRPLPIDPATLTEAAVAAARSKAATLKL